MPFTVSHAAAAWPFRRSPLIPSALVVGTMAPDFQYFIRFAPSGRFGHTIPGIFYLTLPIALLVLWIFHSFVKLPLVSLLPNALQARLSHHLGPFRFFGPARFLLIVFSVLVGIATHILWDSATHVHTWLYDEWPLLRQPVRVPVLGVLPVYKVLQHSSTVVGLLALLVWFVLWYRNAQPRPFRVPQPSSSAKLAIIGTSLVLAVLGATVRAVTAAGMPSASSYRRFAGEFVVTGVALIWWQLVAYGIVVTIGNRNSKALRVTEAELGDAPKKAEPQTRPV